jgi:hypothetical protein
MARGSGRNALMSKQKKFEPPMGWIVGVNHQQVAITRLAQELKMSPIEVGQALEQAGYFLQPDIMDLAADSWKVLRIELDKASNHTMLKIVKEEGADE